MLKVKISSQEHSVQLHITDINLHFSKDCNALKVPVDFNPFWTCTGTLCIDLHQSYTLVFVSFPFSDL